jgi:hypothetical protein
MACNNCEIGFQGSQTVLVSIEKSGTNALLYLQNQGRNIVHLIRISLCRTSSGGGTTTLFLRPPPDAIAWSYPSAFLEPYIRAHFYTWGNIPTGTIVQAQAEYIEIEGRSRSCPTTL